MTTPESTFLELSAWRTSSWTSQGFGLGGKPLTDSPALQSLPSAAMSYHIYNPGEEETCKLIGTS